MSQGNQDIIDLLIKEWKQERPELDASAMGVVGRVLKLGRLFEKRAGKVLQESGIYYTDLDVMATLRRSGTPYELTPKELMMSALITSGAMTALLDRLTKLDLIYRAADSKDGRIKRAGLTKKGIEIRFKEASISIEALSISEQDRLSELLKKLMVSLDT